MTTKVAKPRSSTRRAPNVNRVTKPKAKKQVSSAAASAYSRRLTTTEPKVSGMFRKTNIKHRELLGNVTGSNLFNVTLAIAINPGLALSFPWLSTQASGWEQYKFNKLKYCYYTRTGTTTTGAVILAPDYDAADPPPRSEQQASTYRGAVEEVPWVEEFTCTLDPSSLHPGNAAKYVRTGPLDQNLDIKTYDAANFYACAIDGSPTLWGKLWVEYDIDLMNPQAPPPIVTSSTAHMTVATIAAPFLYPEIQLGSIGIAVGDTPTKLLLTNLPVGSEIQVSYLGNATTPWSGVATYSLGDGLTLKSNFLASTTITPGVATYTVTKSSAILFVTLSANPVGSTFFTVCVIPTSLL